MSHIKLLAKGMRTSDLACLSDAAFRLYITSACYCTEWKMGALLPCTLPFAMARAPKTKKALARAVEELEAAGLWKQVGDNWKINAGTDDRTGRVFWSPVIGQKPWSRRAKGAVFARDGHSCRYCGSTKNLSLDHIVPRRQGGTDHAANLVVACKRCNSKKGARTPEQAGMRLLPVQFETAMGDSAGPISSSESNEETLQ